MNVKQLIAAKLKLKPSLIRVTHGRGTARHWLDITTPTEIESKTQDTVTKMLLKRNLVGRYLTDYGCGVDDYKACILWNVKGA